MTLNNQCLITACDLLGLVYKVFDTNGNCVEVVKNGRSYFFINYSTPFNTEAVASLAKDKYFTYLVGKDVVAMPHTLHFLDPHTLERYQKYVRVTSLQDMASSVEKTFSFPCIVKRNSGSRARNVFSCSHHDEIMHAFKEIFNHHSQQYDYIALAQEFVHIAVEYRVIVVGGEVALVYDKSSLKNIDTIMEEKIQTFLAPLLARIPLGWAGLDVVLTKKNELMLIEINTCPGFTSYVEKNGVAAIVDLYKKALIRLL